MRRYLYLYLPNWSVRLAQRLTRSPAHTALFLVEKCANQLVVKECCPQAHSAGVRSGMTLALANALAPQAISLPFDHERDQKALGILAQWALRYTPFVAIDRYAYGLILDIHGTQRLHSGERQLLEKIFSTLVSYGIDAKAAVAPTVGAAYALARYRNQIEIINHHEIKKALKPLPIEALRISTITCDALQHVGIYRIAELLQVPAKKLGMRFGAELITRLDQAFGNLDEALNFIKPAKKFEIKRAFEVPLYKQASVQAAILRLLEELLVKLQGAKTRAGFFKLELEILDQELQKRKISKAVALHHTTSNFEHISQVLTPIIESLQYNGNVCAICIAAHTTERSKAEQRDLLNDSTDHDLKLIAEELLNNLSVRLGRAHVAKLEMHESHLPEKSYSYKSVEAASKGLLKAGLDQGGKYPVMSERPPYLFSSPQELQAIALLPDNPPIRLRWKGREYQILQASGPEKISSEWWHTNLQIPSEEREYFRVQDQLGRWLWVYRNQQMEWFIQGIWV